MILFPKNKQPELKPNQHLEVLETPFGVRALYDSVSFCNRCGTCAQVCPSYHLSRNEIDSPRGRNQAIRLILEGKLRPDVSVLQTSLAGCTLCGRCMQSCAGKIPTSDHVLEVYRWLDKPRLPILLHQLFSLRGSNPQKFALLFRFILHIRFCWNIAAFIPGLNWLKQASKRITQTPKLLSKILQANIYENKKNPNFIYVPSFEAEFLMPEIALSSIKLIAKKGKTICWLNTPCGLFEYVYGNLPQSKRLLRKFIRKHQSIENGQVPLVTDSLDVYHFLQKAPQLFAKYKRMHRQAEQFATQVRYITDFFPEQITASFPDPVSLDYGTLFSRESHPIRQAHILFKTLFKQNFVECGYTDFDTPAFGYAFTAGNLNSQIMFELVKTIAQKQTKHIFTFSGLCALELNTAFNTLYPAAKAQHIVHLADKI